MKTANTDSFFQASALSVMPVEKFKSAAREKFTTAKAEDSNIKEEALKTFNRHKWYLVPELKMFSLFSNKVTEDEKSRMAANLLGLLRDEEFHFGLPCFPDITLMKTPSWWT